MPDPAMLVPALGMALVHFLWQGAVIGCIAAVALRLLRDASPQARYAVACLALAACVLVPLAGLAGALVSHAPPAIAVDGLGALQATAVGLDGNGFSASLAPFLPWIVSGWAAGACALSLRMAVGLGWLHAMRNAWQPAGAAAWQHRLDRLAPAFGLTRRVALRLVDRLETPASAGWLRPVVLLPAAVAARLPVDLVEALLAHELAHIRRHDYLVNLLQGMAEAALFFHPVTWWLSRRIRIEREQVADRLAVAATGDSRRLAVALAELATLQAEARAAATLACPHLAQAAHGGQLMSRIQSLVQPGRRATGGPLVLPLAGLVLAGVALYAQAQTPATTTPAPPPAPAATQEPLAQARLAQATPAPAAVPVPAVHQGPVLPTPRPAATRRIGEVQSISRDGGRETLRFDIDGRNYVIDDPATVARARAAWRDFEDFGPRMEALAAQMAGHGETMAAMQARMGALHAARAASPDIHEAAARLAAVALEQQQLALEQAALTVRMAGASDAEREALDAKLEALDRQMEVLDRRMEQEDAQVDAASRALEEALAPLEALGREMELAAAPMDALGERMEAIGRQQEEAARVAEARMREVIADAMARGVARPATDDRP